jgi:Na+-transporting NADH:ubiquinone oxidoreductase subunit NqrA
MTVVHLTAKAVGKKRAIVSIETYAPAEPLSIEVTLTTKAKSAATEAPRKEKAKPAPKAAKGNKNSK